MLGVAYLDREEYLMRGSKSKYFSRSVVDPLNRSTVYAPHLAAKPDAQELTLLALIDAEYTRHPFYGSRKIKIYLGSL